VHQVGDSHFELLRAFASDVVLGSVSEAFRACDYQPHEFGDSLLIERSPGLAPERQAIMSGY
jgi:S-adenosylmethionine:tRNA ribosyltransferase-isomerase